MSLIHAVTGEQSRVRRWSLFLFARYVEMPLLRWGYALLRGRYRRLGKNPLVRAAISGGVAIPFGYLGDTGRPMPTAQVLGFIDDLVALPASGGRPATSAIAIGPCRCRTAHGGCAHPLETDIVIRTGVEAWTRAFPHEYRLIDKEEAKRIVVSCSQQGMWPMVFVHCPVGRQRTASLDELAALRKAEASNEYVICNCCPCGCVPFILNRELGQRVYPLLRGPYLAVTDLERCAGHGECVVACPFGVRALVDAKARLIEPCFGCGACVSTCPEGAIQMQA